MASNRPPHLFAVNPDQLPMPTEEVLFAGIQFADPPNPPLPNQSVQYIHKVFNRVFLATRYIFGIKIRTMALPIIAKGLQVHEAHCFALGSFREVLPYEFDEANVDTTHLMHEVEARSLVDPNICAMVRYSVMIILFGFLTVNGATGAGTHDGRDFKVRFTDPRIHDEEIHILRSQTKILEDKKNKVNVNLLMRPTNWSNQPPILSHRSQYCPCLNVARNHFVYVADYEWANLRPGICRMPERPAFFLAEDFEGDPKHVEGCHLIKQRTLLVVPNFGSLQAGAFIQKPNTIPQFMLHPSGYLKFCLDGTQRSVVNMTEKLLNFLPHSGAILIRKDRWPTAEFAVDFF